MLSKDAQAISIKEEQDRNMPAGAKVAVRCLEGLVFAASAVALIKGWNGATDYLNQKFGAPPELTNVVDVRRGEIALGAGYAASVIAIECAIEHYARKIYGKLR